MGMLACLIYTCKPMLCFLFSVFYGPPELDEVFLQQFRTFLDNYSSTNLSNLIVVGDFNFPHIDWCTGGSRVSDPDTMNFVVYSRISFF